MAPEINVDPKAPAVASRSLVAAYLAAEIEHCMLKKDYPSPNHACFAAPARMCRMLIPYRSATTATATPLAF